MIRPYFSTQATSGILDPFSGDISHEEFFESSKRHKGIKDQDTMEMAERDVEILKEELPTWHRGAKENTQNLLQFELEQGVRSDLTNGTLRESESSDQALAIMQGASRASKNNENSNEEETGAPFDDLTSHKGEEWGEENRYARAVWEIPEPAEHQAKLIYARFQEQVAPLRRKLTRTIQLTLEQKQTAARTDLLYGRLGKKLTRFVTDQDRRLFYKKGNPSNQFDSTFVFMVDCSASMGDKMDEIKLAITLFHETLRVLQIPHAVIGFWEDTDSATPEYYPNVFHLVMDFASSLSPASGSNILRLEAKQDNRDGYAIRVVTRYLTSRSEKNRVLLVFTDGEPAAADYHENGILDTHQAVQEARRQKIDVIGVYLASGEVTEDERQMMQNMYGFSSAIVPEIAQLPQYILPILRRLLQSRI